MRICRRTARLSIQLFLLLLSPLVGGAQETYTYTTRGDQEMKLDIYRPANPRPDKATVVYVFGGGFVVGARNDSMSVEACRLLADRGFTAVSIDYRLWLKRMSPDKIKWTKVFDYFDSSIRVATEDCCAALRYLSDNSGQLGIDTSKIILTGSSAGAVTILQTDYCRANSRAEAAVLPAGWKPVAVIPYSGAVFETQGRLKYRTPPAPTCFFHGTEDKIVFYKTFHIGKHRLAGASWLVRHRFQKNRYPYWIMRFKGRGHEVAGYLPDTMQEFEAFVNAALAGRVTYYDAKCEDEALKPNKWTKMNIIQLYTR
ncbi:MAG: alpha/beta hydrolase [Bacteroidales bacterium]|nr:alpha/beta hydrolase [Bacteroidales bacterium]